MIVEKNVMADLHTGQKFNVQIKLSMKDINTLSLKLTGSFSFKVESTFVF